MARLNAQNLGMPYEPVVIVPHPVGGIDLKEVAKKADDALEDLIKAITTPREKLAERTQEQLQKG